MKKAKRAYNKKIKPAVKHKEEKEEILKPVKKEKAVKAEKTDEVKFDGLDELDALANESVEPIQAEKSETKVSDNDIDELDKLCAEEAPGESLKVEETKEAPASEPDELNFEESESVEIKQAPEKLIDVVRPLSTKITLKKTETEAPRNDGCRMNYENFYRELKDCTIELEECPTPDQINVQIARVQALKDRVASMLIDAIRNVRLLEKIYELKYDELIIGREEKSKEQREAAVHQKIRKQLDEFKEAEDYLEVVRQVYDNLISANENISRQVTVLQEQLKLGEFGRPALPPSGKTNWGNVGRK